MLRRRIFSLMLLLGMSWFAAADAPKTMRLASTEWAPYVGARLTQSGWSAQVADAAARQSGFRLEVDFFPWTRAMQLGSRNPAYAGYFPAYYTDERARHCHFSAPIGSSTIGLVYLKNAPLTWSTMQDLSGLNIGVVAGHSNGPAFDAMAEAGRLRIDPSPSDVLNLRKLLARRVDAAVIDRRVLRYLLATESGLLREYDQFAFHDKPLAELTLHVCFQRTPAGFDMRQAFDNALQSLPLRRLESEFFSRLGQVLPPRQP